VVGTSSLQHGLVNPATTGHDANHGAVGRRDDSLGARRQLYPRALGVGVVSDDSGVVARSPGQLAAVASLLLQVGDDGSLRHLKGEIMNFELKHYFFKLKKYPNVCFNLGLP